MRCLSTPHRRTGGVEEGTTKAPSPNLLYTLPRGVGFGCLRVLMEWFEWMWMVALSFACTEARPSGTPGAGTV